MRATILGKRWQLNFYPNLGDKLGDCTDPEKPHRQIRIKQGMPDQEQLEILLHELLHASNWSLDEAHVGQVASDFARILTRLGYHSRCPS